MTANYSLQNFQMCCLSVPFTPIQSFTGKWLFGRVLCKLFPVSQGISVYMSTLTMTIIALDRFVVVCYPYRQRMQTKTSLLFIAIIDFLAVTFVLPYGFHIKLIVGFDGEDRCNEVWSGMSRTVYGIFTVLSQFAFPFVTIILCYSTIIFRLRRRPDERKVIVVQSQQKQELEIKRMKRTNRMLMSMVLIFGSTWLPLNLINLVTDLDLFDMYCLKYYHAAFALCHLIAMSSACFNPFLYGRFNDSFRKEFLLNFPILKFVCGNSEYDDDQNDGIEMAALNIGPNVTVKNSSV